VEFFLIFEQFKEKQKNKIMSDGHPVNIDNEVEINLNDIHEFEKNVHFRLANGTVKNVKFQGLDDSGQLRFKTNRGEDVLVDPPNGSGKIMYRDSTGIYEVDAIIDPNHVTHGMRNMSINTAGKRKKTRRRQLKRSKSKSKKSKSKRRI